MDIDSIARILITLIFTQDAPCNGILPSGLIVDNPPIIVAPDVTLEQL